MIDFNWTVDVGDLLVALLGLVFVPIVRSLVRTLHEIRVSFMQVSVAVFGTERDSSIGLVERMKKIERHCREQSNTVIQ